MVDSSPAISIKLVDIKHTHNSTREEEEEEEERGPINESHTLDKAINTKREGEEAGETRASRHTVGVAS